jgi:hypothetical protein
MEQIPARVVGVPSARRRERLEGVECAGDALSCTPSAEARSGPDRVKRYPTSLLGVPRARAGKDTVASAARYSGTEDGPASEVVPSDRGTMETARAVLICGHTSPPERIGVSILPVTNDSLTALGGDELIVYAAFPFKLRGDEDARAFESDAGGLSHWRVFAAKSAHLCSRRGLWGVGDMQRRCVLGAGA